MARTAVRAADVFRPLDSSAAGRLKLFHHVGLPALPTGQGLGVLLGPWSRAFWSSFRAAKRLSSGQAERASTRTAAHNDRPVCQHRAPPAGAESSFSKV